MRTTIMKQFCWKESKDDHFFGSDKLMHFILHFIVTAAVFWFTRMAWLSIVVSEVIGMLTEIIETTDWWDKVVKIIWPNDGKARCLSVKDLIVNQIGMLFGLIFMYFIIIRFVK